MCSLYVRLCLVADSVAQKCDPEARLLLVCADRDTAYPPDVTWCSGMGWIDTCYHVPPTIKAVRSDHYGISQHIYRYHYNPVLEVGRFIHDVDTIWAVMKNNGESDDRPYWVTETGNHTYPPDSTIKEVWQAMTVTESYVIGLCLPELVRRPAQVLNWWCFGDRRNHPENKDKYFGLVDTLVDEKPSYWAYKQLTQQLVGKEYNRRWFNTWEPTRDDTIFIAEFETPSGLRKWVAWEYYRSGATAHEVRIPVATNQVDRIRLRLNDGTGDSVRIDAGYDSYLRITVDTMPIYIKEVGPVSICDLKVDSLWCEPRPPQDGVKFILKVSITNIGNEAAPTDSGLWVKFYANDNPLDSVYYDSVIDTSETVILKTDSLVLYKDSGPYLIKVIANPDQDFNEATFTNNGGYLYALCPKPPLAGITINQGAEKTDLKFAVLSLEAFDPNFGQYLADSMMILQTWVEGDSNIPYNWKTDSTGWIPYDTVYFWRLRQDPGWNIVRFKVKCGEWNESEEAADTILFDRYQPDSIHFVVPEFVPTPQCTIKSRVFDLSGGGRMRFGIGDLESSLKNPCFDSIAPPWDTFRINYHDSLKLIELKTADSTSIYQVIDDDSLSPYLNDTLLLSIDLATGEFFGRCSVCFIYRYDHPNDQDPPYGVIPEGCKIVIPEGSRVFNYQTRFRFSPGADFIEAWVGVWGDLDSGRVVLDNLRLDPIGPEPEYTHWLVFDTLHTFTLPDSEASYQLMAQYEDSAGNESWYPVDTVTLDTTPPEAVITFPADSQWVSGTITIEGWGYDPDDHFKKYTLYYRAEGNWHGCDPDSVSYQPVYPLQTPWGPAGQPLGDWNTNLVTEEFGNGYYPLRLLVIDSAGHTTADTVIVYINNPIGPIDFGFGAGTSPTGLGAGDDRLYVGDESGKVISYDRSGYRLGEFELKDSLGLGLPGGILVGDLLWVVDRRYEVVRTYKEGRPIGRIEIKAPEFITGGIWVSSGDRLLRIDASGEVRAEVESGPVAGIYYDPDYLVVLQERGLMVIDTAGKTIDTIPLKLKSPSALTGDEHGYFYIADGRGIGLYDRDGSLLYRLPDARPGRLVRWGDYLFVALKDRLWAYRLFGGGGGFGGGPQEAGSHYFFSFRCFPSPFLSGLHIVYSLAEEASPRVRIYDVCGRMVKDYDFGRKKPGFYRLVLKPDLAGGVYFIRFEAGRFQWWEKTVRLK